MEVGLLIALHDTITAGPGEPAGEFTKAICFLFVFMILVQLLFQFPVNNYMSIIFTMNLAHLLGLHFIQSYSTPWRQRTLNNEVLGDLLSTHWTGSLESGGLQPGAARFGSRDALIGLGAYSLGATRFGSCYVLTGWGPTAWGPTVSGYQIWIPLRTHRLGAYSLGAYSLAPPDLDPVMYSPAGGLQSRGLQSGGLQCRTTRF